MIIVQLGTGKAGDNVTKLVNRYKNLLIRFIAVEPLQIHHDTIREYYKHIPGFVLEKRAISPTEDCEKLTLYYHPANFPGYGLTSVSKNHILKHKRKGITEEGIQSVEVDCLTINQLFYNYGLSDIDVLYIDIEGLDFEVIKSIDFTNFKIKHIVYEHLHIDKKESVKFLQSKGYTVLKDVESDKNQFIATLHKVDSIRI